MRYPGEVTFSHMFVYESSPVRRVLNLDGFEKATLCVARHLFATFHHPSEQCWMSAFMEAERAFPPPFGATIAHGITIAIREMSKERCRAFSYFRCDDPLSETATTREEQYLLMTLRGIRRHDHQMARAHALLVCDGGDSDAFLAAIERVCLITGEVQQTRYQKSDK